MAHAAPGDKENVVLPENAELNALLITTRLSPISSAFLTMGRCIIDKSASGSCISYHLSVFLMGIKDRRHTGKQKKVRNEKGLQGNRKQRLTDCGDFFRQ